MLSSCDLSLQIQKLKLGTRKAIEKPIVGRRLARIHAQEDGTSGIRSSCPPQVNVSFRIPSTKPNSHDT